MKIMRKNTSIIYFSYLYIIIATVVNCSVLTTSFALNIQNTVITINAIIFLCGYFCSPLL